MEVLQSQDTFQGMFWIFLVSVVSVFILVFFIEIELLWKEVWVSRSKASGVSDSLKFGSNLVLTNVFVTSSLILSFFWELHFKIKNYNND